nr:hypothetical protein [Tanacetum cinerariifolium]
PECRPGAKAARTCEALSGPRSPVVEQRPLATAVTGHAPKRRPELSRETRPLFRYARFLFFTGVTQMAKATARHILVSSEEKCNELKAQIEGG